MQTIPLPEYPPQGLWGAGHEWPDGSYRVSGFETREDAVNALWRGLQRMGYRVPKWWEFWRWGEGHPPQHKEG